MAQSIQAPHVSLHLPPGLSSFGDVCVESDTTSSCSSVTDLEEEHTLTGFGEEHIHLSETRPLNRLRLKVKRPKKRMSIHEGSSSPTNPTSPISPSIYIDALSRRLAAYRSQSDSDESDTPDQSHAITQPTSSTSSTSSDSCKPGQSVIVKAVPSVAEFPEQPKGWRKLPPRLPIPKWDVDN